MKDPAGDQEQAAYADPELYDLEHALPEPDVEFFIALARQWRPRRILELGCGNGRVTLPLASAAAEWGATVDGLDAAGAMLAASRARDREARVRWWEGDLSIWRAEPPFDLIISPCGSLGHLVTLSDQLRAWRTAYGNLAPGGRFVLSEPMANLSLLADSMQMPPRATVELDLDHQLDGQRLLRYRATRYRASDQRMDVHFFYDRFGLKDEPERLATAYAGHVYFPNELQLLAIAAGFQVEAVWGDHQRRPLAPGDRQIVVVNRREN